MTLNDFIVGIFRMTDALDKSTQSALEQRYIALVPSSEGSASSWYTSDTLFGLQEKLNSVKVIKWEEAERQLLKLGYYKVPYPKQSVHEGEKHFKSQGPKSSWS